MVKEKFNEVMNMIKSYKENRKEEERKIMKFISKQDEFTCTDVDALIDYLLSV